MGGSAAGRSSIAANASASARCARSAARSEGDTSRNDSMPRNPGSCSISSRSIGRAGGLGGLRRALGGIWLSESFPQNLRQSFVILQGLRLRVEILKKLPVPPRLDDTAVGPDQRHYRYV